MDRGLKQSLEKQRSVTVPRSEASMKWPHRISKSHSKSQSLESSHQFFQSEAEKQVVSTNVLGNLLSISCVSTHLGPPFSRLVISPSPASKSCVGIYQWESPSQNHTGKTIMQNKVPVFFKRRWCGCQVDNRQSRVIVLLM